MPSLPNLPPIDDQAKWDRIYAAFQGSPAVYRAWLTRQIIDHVRRFEQDIAMQAVEQDVQTLLPPPEVQ